VLFIFAEFDQWPEYSENFVTVAGNFVEGGQGE